MYPGRMASFVDGVVNNQISMAITRGLISIRVLKVKRIDPSFLSTDRGGSMGADIDIQA
jgi:hypothetical protein